MLVPEQTTYVLTRSAWERYWWEVGMLERPSDPSIFFITICLNLKDGGTLEC